MARPASGSEHIEAARKLLKTARTADELRLAQLVAQNKDANSPPAFVRVSVPTAALASTLKVANSTQLCCW